jgi:F0F1-type ATP synthase beta subunit
MDGTEGLVRGQAVKATGAPIKIPVGVIFPSETLELILAWHTRSYHECHWGAHR